MPDIAPVRFIGPTAAASGGPGLRVSKSGRVYSVTWFRGRWESMTHLADGDTRTRCGCDVLLGFGVDRICFTFMPTELMLAIGCGLCRIALIRDMHTELLAADPDALTRWRSQLAREAWITERPSR